MTQPIETVESAWRMAMDREDADAIERIVREVLREHPHSTLACEIRYQRGMLTLTEGEGTGMERLARALVEFEEGMKSSNAVGEAAEPWRSLNHTQYGICMARRGNLAAAETALKTVSEYRPRTVNGIGALALLETMLEKEGKPREAKRYASQRLSYARALARESKQTQTKTPDEHLIHFLLAQELLQSEFASEGKELLHSLQQLGSSVLGEELFQQIQHKLQSLPS